jgi:hypothetical protein
MTWFAVHTVITVQRVDQLGPISIYENIFLVQAANSSQAKLEGERLVKPEVDSDDDLTIDGFPAKRTFAGIRKVVNVSNPEPLDLDNDRPVSGTEITYSEFEVDTEDDVIKFVSGQELLIKCVD